MCNVQCAIFLSLSLYIDNCTLYFYRLPPPQPQPPHHENPPQPPPPNQLDQLPPELLGAITLDLILLVIDENAAALSKDQL